MILRIEFIDTETISMYKKMHCERHRYIYLWYLKIRGYLYLELNLSTLKQFQCIKSCTVQDIDIYIYIYMVS